MRSLVRRSVVGLTASLIVLSGAPGFAQPTSSISGTVIDSGGGSVPGASVIVKGESGVSFETVTNNEGLFSVPAVGPGLYIVTVALTGFKTAVVRGVRVLPGMPASVKARLEVGRISESVTVMSSSELFNTETANVSSTLNADELNRMPTATRNALNAVAFLPGVDTETTNRESRINGLPESLVNITMDGVSNNDNFLRSSDSFFASVTPRQDAVEAVSVTTAVQGAQTGGSGAVGINFATRSGTNVFRGSGYEYWRDTSLNTNYWFNTRNGLPRNEVRLNQYGGRLGGPIVIPGLYDGHNKAFFFAHYEQLRFPNTFTRTRVTLHPRASEGWFRYTVNGQTREVNVLQLAALRGQIAATDPTVMSILRRIQGATESQGVVSATSDPMLNQYAWQSPGRLFEHQPTVKIDYNLTSRHRLSGSTSIIWALRDPDFLNGVDARFPGAPNYRLFHSTRPLTTFALRSTLTRRAVNEVRAGITAAGGASYFGDLRSNGPQSFADQGGYALNFPDFDTTNVLTNWFATNNPSWRSAPTYSVDESLTWQKGKHSLGFGVSFLRATAWENAQNQAPGIDFGFSTTNDPAASLFSTANFPDASAGQLADARDLYAMLTGRVSQVTGQAALDPVTDRYVLLGPRRREGRIDMYSGFVQDSWRMTRTLTLTGGLRWDVQLPFSSASDVMTSVTMADLCGSSGPGSGGPYHRCNFFVPGSSGGKVPVFNRLTKGTLGYRTDWNNVAPSFGVAWRPNVQKGWLRTLLGNPEQATVRGGYTRAFERQGMAVFTDTFGANQGSIIGLSRSESLGNLVTPGQSWPVLFSETSRLGPAAYPLTPVFPIAVRPNRADSLNGFAPDLKIGSADTWSGGVQRAVSKDMAVEVRYVGTNSSNQWSTINYNGIRTESLIANGFLDEFKRAMANLRANNAAGGGRAGSFAYFGAGSGTSPLPVYLAYLNGSADAGNPAAYTGGTNTWTNTTFAGRLVASVPSPTGSAGDLDGNATRRANAAAAGLPANFFVLNPDVSAVNVTDSGAFSKYHALQVIFRRRLSKGVSANVNYQYAIQSGSAFDGFSFGRTLVMSGNVRHAIKTQWDWTLPVGRGHRFGPHLNPVLEAIAGGWSLVGVGRVQARVVNFGNVRLVGMSHKDLQRMYRFDIRVDPATGLPTVFMLPDDVILNTRRAFSVSSTTADGYSASLGAPEGRYIAPANRADCIQMRAGDCAPRAVLVRAPWFTRFDIGVMKRFPIQGRVNLEIRLDLLNALDNINFTAVANPGTGATIFQTTSAYTDASNTYDPGGRLGQLMFRINW
jgi:hypothetical protein